MCFSRIRFVLLPVSLVLLIGFSVAAQEPDNSATETEIAMLEKRVADFFADLQASRDSKNSSKQTFRKVLLKEETPLASAQLLSDQKKPALQSLVAKTDALQVKFGNYRGSDKISAKSIGKDLVLLKYLYKCERYPIVWHFTFYRTAPTAESTTGPWIVIAVRFDTELELLALDK
jgi:hypothetical protein